MALQQYNGTAGNFMYDDTQFRISENSGLLQYIGDATDGRFINIPEGITVIDGMFRDNKSLTVPPKIPYGVMSMNDTFSGCENLRSYPDIPSSVNSMHHAFSRISMHDIQVIQDPTEQYIMNEMQQSFDEIEAKYQQTVMSVENSYFGKTYDQPEDIAKAREKSAKKITKAQLKADIAICRANLAGLEKMQTNIAYKITEEVKHGAPVDYMRNAFFHHQNQIAAIKSELGILEDELRLRNPTVSDLVKTNAIKAKEWIVSAGQRAVEKMVDKLKSIRESAQKVKGNIYRSTELAAEKFELKLAEMDYKQNQKDLQRTAKIYNKVMPAVCKVSLNMNNLGESLRGFRENMKGQNYQVQPGLSERGKKLVESMYKNMENKMLHTLQSQSYMESQKLFVDNIQYNLSSEERRQSISFLRDVQDMAKDIKEQSAAALDETIAHYEKIGAAAEKGDTVVYEQDMSAEDISNNYPIAVRSAMQMGMTSEQIQQSEVNAPVNKSQNPADFIQGYLFNETATAKEEISQDEFAAKVEEVMDSIKDSSNDRVDELVARAQAQGVHVKEDHAEVLSASSSSRKNYMNTEVGRKAQEQAQAMKDSSKTTEYTQNVGRE